MQAPPASLTAIRILEGEEATEIGAADSGKPTLSFWEDAAMKYTIELNDWEAIALATLILQKCDCLTWWSQSDRTPNTRPSCTKYKRNTLIS